MNITWKRVTTFSLPNLNVLVVNGVEVGFVTKPQDNKYDKNMWRVFRGIGEDASLLCHCGNKTQAQRTLEKVYVGS